MTDYEMESLVKSMRRASFPWSERKSKSRQEEYRQTDSPLRISKCLECPFSECVNCYSDKRSAFAILMNSGMNRVAICNALSISRRTFFYFKSELKGA